MSLNLISAQLQGISNLFRLKVIPSQKHWHMWKEGTNSNLRVVQVLRHQDGRDAPLR